MGCQSQLPVEDEQSAPTDDKRDKAPLTAQAAYKGSNAMTNSNAPFPVLHQGFNHNTHPWADQSDPGPYGWCGTVEHQNKKNGNVKPSKGNGYATVEWGPCNDFYTNAPFYFEASAPGSTLDFPSLSSSTWPSNGYFQQLDIYLDPDDYDEGLAFIYANSVHDVDEEFGFYYASAEIMKITGALDVAGHSVEEKGWYTFRYVFDSDASGFLTVEFQLEKDGQVIHTKSVEEGFLSGVELSTLSVSELGSGYCWFAFIAEGVSLPIDEQHLAPGK
jgi:hypothetical protein